METAAKNSVRLQGGFIPSSLDPRRVQIAGRGRKDNPRRGEMLCPAGREGSNEK